MKPEVAPDAGLLIDNLARAYEKTFGDSRIGPRERLNAAHLIETLEKLNAEPDRVRGALRAALAKTRAEIDIFDRVYGSVGRPEEPAPRSEAPESVESEDAGPTPARRLKVWWRLGGILVLGAIVVAAVFLLLRDETDRPGDVGTSGGIVRPAPQDEDNVDETTAPAPSAPPVDVFDLGDDATTAYASEVRALLEEAREFGYRPSARELASVLNSSQSRLSRAEATRVLARSAGQAPDAPLDLFSADKLAAVHAAIHGPVSADTRDSVLSQVIVERALEATEYLAIADGRLAVHWRDGNAWKQRVLEGDIGQDDVRRTIVSADGSHALTIGTKASALWDLVGLKRIDGAQFPRPQVTDDNTVEAAFFVPGSNTAFVVVGDGSVFVSPDNRSPPWGTAVRAEKLFASASGSGFAIVGSVGGVGRVEVFDAVSQRLRGSITPERLSSKEVLSDNLELVALAVGASTEIWSPTGGRLLTLPLSQEYGEAYFVANDTRLLINHVGGMEIYDTLTGQLVSRFEEALKGTQSATAHRSSDGRLVFLVTSLESGARSLAVADASTGQMMWGVTPLAEDWRVQPVPGIAGLSTFASLSSLPDGTFGFEVGYISESNLTLPESTISMPRDVFPFINIPSMAEASARAAAFARKQQVETPPDWPMWLAVAIPLLIAGGVLAYPAAWRRAYLSRRKIESDTLIRKLTANVTTFEPLAGERRAVGRLDQRQHRPSHRLNLRETVLATARAGGLFTPVTDTDAGTPEYVALIERRRLTDSDAERMVAFFSRLRAAGLSLTLYSYSGTPEALTPLRGGRAISIEALRQRHAGAFLFITGDVDRFYNRRSGTAAAWTRRIGPVNRTGQAASFTSTWSGGAFLSREPIPRLGLAERAIERDLGLMVRHTDASDLMEIGEYFHGRSSSLGSPAETAREPVPAYFAERPERFMQEEPPGQVDRQSLLPELRAWVGDEGGRWVRSLAYYPIVQWDLALFLASVLMPHPSAERRAEMEAKVARLPWLEHGFMPDWVRETLVQDADPKEERRIVREIVTVMAEAREGADGNVSFQVADAERGLAGDHSGDTIFIDAVARAKARPWDLPPPSQWLRNAPEVLQMPWARLRIGLAGIVLAAAAAMLTPHSGNIAPIAQWAPIVVFGVLALVMSLTPPLLTRLADRRRG